VAAKAALGVAIVALGAVVLFTVVGALPRIVSTVGGAVSGIAGAVLPSQSPNPALAAVPVAPVLDAPAQSATNQASVTVTGSVPASIVGRRADIAIRLYVALPDKERVKVRDVPLGETPGFAIPNVPLQPGRNDFSATVVGPFGESEASPIVTYVLDTTKPKIVISSPADKAIVKGTSVTIVGTTQGGSAITARNAANGRTAFGAADGAGSFQVVLPLANGTNAISVTATDPAGNAATFVLTVRRGTGELKITLTASPSRVSAAKLPSVVELRAVATDPAGNSLAGRDITFTLSIPGVPPISGQETTDAAGAAVFRTSIPAGATPGPGGSTASLTTPEYGDASGRVVITITP
jgi:Glucodextranase, domain B